MNGNTAIAPKDGVLFNLEEFDNVDGYIDRAIKEANFVCGYKKLFNQTITDSGQLAEGLDIVKSAYNVRANLYRWRDIRATKRLEYARTPDDDPDKPKKLKELLDIADRLVLYGFEIVRLREPMDMYLALMGLPERPRKKLKDGAVMYDV